MGAAGRARGRGHRPGRRIPTSSCGSHGDGPDAIPATASNPEQLVDAIRWASVHASRAASQVTPHAVAAPLPPPPVTHSVTDDLSEVLW